MIRKLILSTITTLGMLVALAAPLAVTTAPVYAAGSKETACEGIGLAASGNVCGNGGVHIQDVIASVVNILSIVVGVAAVIMVIVSGFKYVTSGGDSNKVASAKTTLVYAIVGLIIVALAQFIVHFVLTNI